MSPATYEKNVLDNGLRGFTTPLPHTRSVCISFFIGAGSRYESPETAGLSHFIEHLLFKGTLKFPTAQAISEAIEGVGGILNAGTDRELTVYWCKVAQLHFSLAIDVLADMLYHPLFDPDEADREKKVVIEEIRATLDSPHERVDTLIDEVIWPDQALGRDVAGSEQSVSALSHHNTTSYFAHQYTPVNTVISVAGNVTHEEVVERIAAALGSWEGENPGSWHPAQNNQTHPRTSFETKKTEQLHLCLAVRGLPTQHPDRYNLDLINVVLGEGMSSRLFLQLRERQGLAYDVHSYVSHFQDSGALTVHSGVDPKRAETAVSAILEQMGLLKDEISPTELTKAKEY